VRHVRMLGLCLVAAFAVGALAASSSSAALPEWGKCVKLPAVIKGVEKTKGKFANSNCTEAATGGAFEFVKGTSELAGGPEFTNTMTSAGAKLETSFGISVECTGEHAAGDLSGTKEVSNLQVKFTGCTTLNGILACENQWTEPEETIESLRFVEGEIVTKGLKGKLVYLSGAGTASPVVGLQLEPAEKNGWFAFFGCGNKGEHPAPVIDSIVGRKPQGANGGDKILSPITPLNAMGTETTQVYSVKKVENPETHELEVERGVQEPDELNGKPAHLETQLFIASEPGASEWGKASQEEVAVTKLNSGEELEIKA
jgi:hypothetical protein